MAQRGKRKAKQGGNEKSDRNQNFRNKRLATKPTVNLDRFAGSSDDEPDRKPKRKANTTEGKSPIDVPVQRKANNTGGKSIGGKSTNTIDEPIQGVRAAKRARKQLAEQKLKEENMAKKEARGTKGSPPSGWQLKGGVVAKDIVIGTGKPAKAGYKVSITYEGSLPEAGKKVFDSRLNPNNPFQFSIGSSEVVEGLEIGVAGMKVGGTRVITIPPEMGYGEEGSPPEIPSDATLEFKVELLSFFRVPH